MIPFLHVGDPVTFECSSANEALPRWQYNDDTEGLGVWARGTVTEVTNRVIRVDYTIAGRTGTGSCSFPNFDHEEYDSDQWRWEGYLCYYPTVPAIQCECGSEKLYGINTSHSSWCPKYK